jgi:hypothetical protein
MPGERWKIWVSGYGEFDFFGTEEEAEDMRIHKARWERGLGQKWRAENQQESDRLTAKIVSIWETGAGVPQSLFKRRKEARLAEQKMVEAFTKQPRLTKKEWAMIYSCLAFVEAGEVSGGPIEGGTEEETDRNVGIFKSAMEKVAKRKF